MQVLIITPAQKLAPLEADHVTLPAFDGEVGIRTGHAAFICELGEGVLHVKQGGSNTRFRLAGGVAQVEKDQIDILAERAEAL